MHAIIKVIPDHGWTAQVQLQDVEAEVESVETWLRDELIERVLPYQEGRGGGVFLLVIPDEVVEEI